MFHLNIILQTIFIFILLYLEYTMSPSDWGPPTWIFMHTLAEKVKEDRFAVIGPQVIAIFIQICANLPCPECAAHAKMFWTNVKTPNIKTKQDLINLLFVFHNTVNKRKKQPLFRLESLQYYKSKSVIETFNQFVKNFNTRGNMNLLTESFHRARFISSLRGWLMKTIAVNFDII